MSEVGSTMTVAVDEKALSEVVISKMYLIANSGVAGADEASWEFWQDACDEKYSRLTDEEKAQHDWYSTYEGGPLVYFYALASGLTWKESKARFRQEKYERV